MNKIASYLQNHLSGEVLTSEAAREYFSTDASILRLKPSMIVYPRTTNDIRKVARFSWQLAEKGHKLPITARGNGTDQAGAALSSGVILAMTAHLGKILEIDTKQKLVRLQPGINFKSLQETLHTHRLFLPPYPASYMYSSIGGAIGNNTAGEKSLKYGAMRSWVDKLEVVLANGEVIQTGRISRRELNKKKGLGTLEGEIYREIDAIVTDNAATIERSEVGSRVSKDSVGYALGDIKRRDGSFDLTPLFVGSQGTLGVVVEAIVRAAEYTPATQLMVVGFDTLASLVGAVDRLRALDPSALEMVDGNLLNFVESQSGGGAHRGLFGEGVPNPAFMLFVEFDEVSDRIRAKKAKRAKKIIDGYTDQFVATTDLEVQENLWSIRHSAATVTNYDGDGRTALPIIEDGVVPYDRFEIYVAKVYELFASYSLEVALWGHAGDANLHMQPLLDLSKLGDRQKVFKLMDEYYRLVIDLGGSIAAEHNVGRLRAPYVALQMGAEMAQLYLDVKKVFDPHNILNPGTKLGTELKDLPPMLRGSYNLAHLADHLPRT